MSLMQKNLINYFIYAYENIHKLKTGTVCIKIEIYIIANKSLYVLHFIHFQK